MERLALDKLPRHSEWAGYLLDTSRDPPGEFDAYTDLEVYDDIYGRVLNQFHATDLDREAFALETRSRGREEPGLISVDEELFLSSSKELYSREKDAVREALKPVLEGDETVLALGCGWGKNLGIIADCFPDMTVVGGEITEKGVAVSRELHAEDDRISVEQFDFQGEWDIFDVHDEKEEIVVFTRGALTTLIGVESVIDRFASRADAGTIRAGVHLEQTGPHPEDTVLGLLRQKYADVRDYDLNLLSVLREHSDISVTHTDYDVLGANPLHPQTAIRWRPA